MADRIEDTYGVHVDVIEGDRGEFTVWLDGKLVAEKTPAGFPDDDAVIDKLRGPLAQVS